jgi:3-dehydroquinate synthase
MKKVTVRLKEKSYDIIVGNNISKTFPALIRKSIGGGDAILITNATIARCWGSSLQGALKKGGFSPASVTIPDNEKAKSLFYLNQLLKRIATASKGKQPFIIALGGGVVGDLAGFAAAIFKRGVPYIQIPTTLLAQIDSSIGGKTAIDLSEGKNLIGSFYQPALVLVDIAYLKSLPRKEVKSGLAEMIKYAVIKDAQLFALLEKSYADLLCLKAAPLEYAILRCAKIKADIVSKDEREQKGIRTILNFGHTVGHAIEIASNFKYNHGEAIALGMLAALNISRSLRLISLADYSRIFCLIKACQLPTRLEKVNYKAIMNSLSFDKKFIGKRNRFVLPVKIGKVIIKEGIDKKIIMSAIKALKEIGCHESRSSLRAALL